MTERPCAALAGLPGSRHTAPEAPLVMEAKVEAFFLPIYFVIGACLGALFCFYLSRNNHR
ncbi:hypothetical protein IPZ68_11640 [Streptomyces arenae]|nr:hypothetical protein [Streptomyces arenae]